MFNFPNYKLTEIKMPSPVDWEYNSRLVVSPGGSLFEINAYINKHIEYKLDERNYWQSSAETFELGTGDCEDFCVAKYALLRDAGFEEMAVIVGKDSDGENHALLFVRDKVLDNRTPIIHPASYYHKFFTPIYAVNHEKAWFYSPDLSEPETENERDD